MRRKDHFAGSSLARASLSSLLFACLLLSPLALGGCGTLGLGPFKDQGKAGKNVSGQVVPHGKTITVWFVRPEGEELELVPVERPRAGKEPIKAAVEQLLKGPDSSESEKGIASEIPRGTILLSMERTDGGIDLNLSHRFSAGGGPASMQARLDQVQKTIASVAGDDKVYLSVEGERLSAAKLDGLEIKQPIN